LEQVIVRAALPEKPIEPLLRAVLGIREAIEDSVAVPAIANQAGVSQVRKVTRYVGLRGVQHMLDIAHAQLTVKEQIENPQASRVRQRLKVVFESLQVVLCLPAAAARLPDRCPRL